MNPPVKVLAFDVFGTVVDWHGTIAREVDALDLGVSGNDFATEWRSGYAPAMDRVRKGELGWTRIDDLHRMILDGILERHGIDLDEAARRHLNLVWHRLGPWPDTLAGLERLRSRFTICTLSNGNLGLLADMAKNAGIRWDLILSAEVFRHYKPDPETYLGVCDIFDIEPGEMMLVAAHRSDLRAAAACGCRTAFIERPLEFGPAVANDVRRDPAFDLHARDLGDLADQLGCA
ncbi:MAG: haloacid dehalogenase type II [Pseudomonadota bacterium]|nr:haloacid dehalogenase type II [Pseudomonadota bacterium]